MRVLGAALLAHAILVGAASTRNPCAGRTGFPAGTVGELGGHMRDRGTIYVLESSEHPSVLVLPSSCEPPRRVFLQSVGRLQFGGIARAADGSLCALSVEGHRIECFDESSGRPLRRYELVSRVQAIWTIRGGLAYARYEPTAGRPLLFFEGSSGFSSDRSFTSRGAPSESEILFRAPGPEAAAMVANLIQCGLGSPGAVPCWRMLTGEMRLVGRASDTPAFPTIEIPNAARSFPIRDVLRTEAGVLWLIINDPMERKDEPVGPGRRLLRFQSGRGRVQDLAAPARAILDGDDGAVLVLFRDGSASWRSAVVP